MNIDWDFGVKFGTFFIFTFTVMIILKDNMAARQKEMKK